jgi:hypothetical protein
MRTLPSLPQRDSLPSWLPGSRGTSAGQAPSSATDHTRWLKGLTPGAVGTVLRRVAATPSRILRTRPPSGSFVPMGTSVDLVVASTVSGSRGEPLGGTGFVDHDSIAQLEHEVS